MTAAAAAAAATATTTTATYHAIEQVESSESNGLILVIKTLQDQVLVSLYTLGMSAKDLGHRHQSKVLHYNTHNTCTSDKRLNIQTRPVTDRTSPSTRIRFGSG